MRVSLTSNQYPVDGTRSLSKKEALKTQHEVPLLSVVVPCYNDEAVIGETVKRLKEFSSEVQGLDTEFIFINDGSSDRTWELLKSFAAEDRRIKLIGFTRNFGHQIAVTAGIDAARGDAIVLMDSDLQDPPEVIHEMIEKWREGHDVIYGLRSERDGESAIRLAITRQFYRFLNFLSDIPIPENTGDFRLMTRNVANTLRAMPEHDRFIRGLVSWVGLKQIAVKYRRAPRFAGKSNYSISKLIRLASDGLLSFSTKPLQLSVLLGMISASISLVVMLYALFLRIFTHEWFRGWAALMISVLFVGGVQLICLGILGEYVGRIYNEIRRRPLYIVQEYCGFEDGGPLMSRSPISNANGH